MKGWWWLLGLAASWNVQAGTPLPDGPHIVVSGEAKVSVKPDSARIRFDFEHHAESPLPAKQSVDSSVNTLLAVLQGYGVADADISASDLNAAEDVEYTDSGKRVSNGYEATRSVTVVLKEIDRLNELLDDGLRSGAREIGTIVFESRRAEDLREQAKLEAVAEARAKAADMAKAFGADIGPVYSIDSVGSRLASGYGATTLDSIVVTGSRAAGGRYLQPTVEYAASVSAVFELLR